MNRKIRKQINKNLFNEIDIRLLSGIKCEAGNQSQQNYFESLKAQTESALINKKFEKF